MKLMADFATGTSSSPGRTSSWLMNAPVRGPRGDRGIVACGVTVEIGRTVGLGQRCRVSMAIVGRAGEKCMALSDTADQRAVRDQTPEDDCANLVTSPEARSHSRPGSRQTRRPAD